MPTRAHRSRSFRKVKRRVSSGESRIVYRRKRPSSASCAVCKGQLHGVPSENSQKMQGMAKSKKGPTRAYSGVLCPRCLREKIKNEKVFSFKS